MANVSIDTTVISGFQRGNSHRFELKARTSQRPFSSEYENLLQSSPASQIAQKIINTHTNIINGNNNNGNKSNKSSKDLSHSLYLSVLKDFYKLCSNHRNEFLSSKSDKNTFNLIKQFEFSKLLYNEIEKPCINYKCIHIAGTNGKGSVSTKLAHALHEGCGYRVGLFTSPHISCVRERILINNEMIDEIEFIHDLQYILRKMENLKLKILLASKFNNNNNNNINNNILENINIKPFEFYPTFFQILTMMAFHHFHKKKCDFVVIETGMGGRYDATNVIESPLLSVITSISHDHSNYLGSTIEEITSHKAGIIKGGVPVVIGPRVPFSIIMAEIETQYHIQLQKHSKYLQSQSQSQSQSAQTQSQLKKNKNKNKNKHSKIPIKSKLFTIGIHMPWPIQSKHSAADYNTFSNLDVQFARAQEEVKREERLTYKKHPPKMIDNETRIRSSMLLPKELSMKTPSKSKKSPKKNRSDVTTSTDQSTDESVTNSNSKSAEAMTTEEKMDLHKNVEFTSFDSENTSIAQLSIRVLSNEYILPIIDGKLRKLSMATIANRPMTKARQFSILDNLLLVKPKCRIELFSLKNNKMFKSNNNNNNNNNNKHLKTATARAAIHASTVNVILDVSHNLDGINALFKSLQTKYLNNYATKPMKKIVNNTYFPNKKFNYRCVVGLSKQNKNELNECLSVIMNYARYIHFVENTLVASKCVTIEQLQASFDEIKNEKLKNNSNNNNSSSNVNIPEIVYLQNRKKSSISINDDNGHIKIDATSPMPSKRKSKKQNIIKQVQYAIRQCCDKNYDLYCRYDEKTSEFSHSGTSGTSGTSSHMSGTSQGLHGITPPGKDRDRDRSTDDSNSDKKDSSIENSNELCDSEKREIVIVLGSFFIMHDARKAIGIKEPVDNIEYK